MTRAGRGTSITAWLLGGVVLALVGGGAYLALHSDAAREAQQPEPLGSEVRPELDIAARGDPAPSPLLPGDRDARDGDRANLLVRVLGLELPLELDPPLHAWLDAAAPASPAIGLVRPAAERFTGTARDGTAEIPVTARPGTWALRVGAMEPLVAGQAIELKAIDQSCDIDARQYAGFSGRIVDEKGHAIAGARVTLTLYDATPPAARGTFSKVDASGAATSGLFGHGGADPLQLVAGTRPDGSFTLPFLPADKLYKLEAAAPGRQSKALHPIVPGGPRILPLDDIVLTAGRAISCRVVDEAGAPVSGCMLMASAAEVRPPTGWTDADGRFLFANLPSGPVTVWTERRDVVNAGKRIDEPGDVDVTLVLRQGVWVDATVHDANGKAQNHILLMGFAEADADADSTRLGDTLAAPRRTLTGEDGHARLGPFAPGPVRVSEPSLSFFETVVQAPCSVDLVLPAPTACDVVLRFMDAADMKPIFTSGKLSARWGDDAYAGGVSDVPVTPDRHGEWSFTRDIPAGVPVQLAFEFSGFESAVIENPPWLFNASEPIDCLLKRQASVLVQLVDAGQTPVAGASVTLLWGVDPAQARSLRRSTDGAAPQSAEYAGFGKLAAFKQLGTSGSDGRARFARVGDGPVAWLITATGFQPVVGKSEQLARGRSHAGDAEVPDIVLILTAADADSASGK